MWSPIFYYPLTLCTRQECGCGFREKHPSGLMVVGLTVAGILVVPGLTASAASRYTASSGWPLHVHPIRTVPRWRHARACVSQNDNEGDGLKGNGVSDNANGNVPGLTFGDVLANIASRQIANSPAEEQRARDERSLDAMLEQGKAEQTFRAEEVRPAETPR